MGYLSAKRKVISALQAFIKKEVLRLQNKKELSSDDAALIDSIKILFNYLKEHKFGI